MKNAVMADRMAETQRKLGLFTQYAGEICPACGLPKRRLRWLCLACRAIAGSQEKRTPTFNALEAACSAHCDAAEAFIESAKRHG